MEAVITLSRFRQTPLKQHKRLIGVSISIWRGIFEGSRHFRAKQTNGRIINTQKKKYNERGARYPPPLLPLYNPWISKQKVTIKAKSNLDILPSSPTSGRRFGGTPSAIRASKNKSSSPVVLMHSTNGLTPVPDWSTLRRLFLLSAWCDKIPPCPTPLPSCCRRSILDRSWECSLDRSSDCSSSSSEKVMLVPGSPGLLGEVLFSCVAPDRTIAVFAGLLEVELLSDCFVFQKFLQKHNRE